MDVPTGTDGHVTWRRALVVSVAAAGFLLAALATAWACTTQSHVSSLEPGSAPAGAEISVSGEEYAPNEKVEVRWESDDGPVLATTTTTAEGTFTIAVTLPTAADPGEHLVFAIAPDLYPAAGRGAAMVDVQASDPAPEPATAPAEQEAQAPPPAEQPSDATDETSTGDAAATTESEPAPVAAESHDTTATPATSSDEATAPADRGGAAAIPPALQRDHVVAMTSSPQPAEAAPAVAAEPATDWVGTPADTRAQPGLGLGVGLLAVGLVVLFAGAAGAVLTGRRQRAEAE